MDLDQLLAAVNASGATPEMLTVMLSRTAILGQVSSKRAEIVRKQEERQAAIDVFDGDLRVLQGELAQLEAYANSIL